MVKNPKEPEGEELKFQTLRGKTYPGIEIRWDDHTFLIRRTSPDEYTVSIDARIIAEDVNISKLKND